MFIFRRKTLAILSNLSWSSVLLCPIYVNTFLQYHFAKKSNIILSVTRNCAIESNLKCHLNSSSRELIKVNFSMNQIALLIFSNPYFNSAASTNAFRLKFQQVKIYCMTLLKIVEF